MPVQIIGRLPYIYFAIENLFTCGLATTAVMSAKYLILLLAILQLPHVKPKWTNVEVIGGENSKSGLIVTNLRWGRINRTTYVANGLFDITEDFSNAYDVMRLLIIAI